MYWGDKPSYIHSSLFPVCSSNWGWNEQTKFGPGRVSGTEAEFRTAFGLGNYDK